MAFRKYGGIWRNPTNNIVRNTYSISKDLALDEIGTENSKVL